MTQFSLVLKGGRVIDPSQGIDDDLDLAIEDGRVAQLGADILPDLAERVLDVSGRIVTPGLIDLHTHLYWNATTVGIDADCFCLPHGTTTAIDAGTSGAFNVAGLRHLVAQHARTRILAFLNIAATGLLNIDIPWESFPAFTNVAQAVEALRQHRHFLVGVKVRASEVHLGQQGLRPVELAREAAEQAGLPMMVHMGASPPLRELLPKMRHGDILTHAFSALSGLAWEGDEPMVQYEAQGTGKTLLSGDGQVLPEVWAASKRGVRLDVGHGLNSFDFSVCQGAMRQGLEPDTISSDIHRLSVNARGCELTTVMSKFLALGMALPEIIRRTTITPAQVIGRAGELGTLTIGAVADVAVFELQEGVFEFEDCAGQTVRGSVKLVTTQTIREGTLVWSHTMQPEDQNR